jgi:D-alanyl-D-alanine carboxypeptidase/D-alanyl-D-alanine-endopeptidase (penicillin-binding protein 4)
VDALGLRRGRIAATMNRPFRIAPLLVLLALLPAAAHAGRAFDDPLPQPVSAALAQAGLPADALAAIAIPQTRWAWTWQHRADEALQPGSTIKLVTSVVALDRLGPNHRGSTELYAAGPIEQGVLTGDLVLKGGADPDLDLPALWQMLFELRQRGVHTIAGDLRLDRSLFRPSRIDLGLAPFDEAPEWPYNRVPDALMLAGNLMGLVLASDGQTLSARLAPPLEGVHVDAGAMRLSDADCSVWSQDWQAPLVSQDAPTQWQIRLQGAFPRRCEASAQLQLLDRDVLAERQLRALWASLGGRWTQAAGQVREAVAPPGAVRIARHESRPWGEVLRSQNKRSDNLLARLLFLQLGLAAMASEPATPTLELARREVLRWFDEHGIERPGLVLDNGSGLSRSERIAPRSLARLLEVALQGPHAPELLASLPVAGVDGSLRRRLKGGAAEGWARLKTGSLKDVVSLAGTVRDTRGATWIVVAMINHPQAGEGRPVLDALVEWVASSGARWR